MSEFRKRILAPMAYPLTAAVFIAVIAFSLSRILLAIPEKWSTTTALLVAAEILGVASVVAAGTRVRIGQKMVLALVGLSLIAGGGYGASLGVRSIEQIGITVPLTAKGIKFVETKLTLPANNELTIRLLNDDAGTPHNVNVTSDEAGTTSIAKSAIVTGVASATAKITGLKPGTYYFHCDVHPSMKGTITAAVGAAVSAVAGPAETSSAAPVPTSTTSVAPGTGSDSTDIVAKGIQFTTPKVTLKAGGTDTINFQNDDTGVPHNVNITKDQAGQTSIFKTDIVTGPARMAFQFTAPAAGLYYFHCDVHPNMTGTITFG